MTTYVAGSLEPQKFIYFVLQPCHKQIICTFVSLFMTPFPLNYNVPSPKHYILLWKSGTAEAVPGAVWRHGERRPTSPLQVASSLSRLGDTPKILKDTPRILNPGVG